MNPDGSKRRRSVFSGCVLAVVLVAGGASTASAQVATATIQGEVTDETKGVLPGVSVTARSEQTGVSRFAITDERGWYRITALQPGRYSLTAEVSGFSTVQQSGVTLTIGQEVIPSVPTASGIGAGNRDGDFTSAPIRTTDDNGDPAAIALWPRGVRAPAVF